MKSALECVLDESLRAYPDASHERLHEYFAASTRSSGGGATEGAGLDGFRAAWSRAYADSRVFGQKSALDVKRLANLLDNSLETDGCGIDFDKDPTSGTAHSGRRVVPGARGSLASQGVDVKTQCNHLLDLYSRLNQLEDKVRMVAKRPGAAAANAYAVANRLVAQRKHLRAVKVAWSGSRRPQRLVSAYSPLACAVAATVAETSAKASSGHRVMRALQILYGMGSAKIQLDEISSSHFVGYKISNDDAYEISLAWELYSDLCHISAFQDPVFHLFPIPVLAAREAEGSLFAFEVPAATPVKESILLRSAKAKAAFCRALRAHSDIVALWARQLGCAYECLRQGQHGNLIDIRCINIDNLFVREDARLILGNVYSAHARQAAAASAQRADKFSAVAISFLLDALCLTRNVLVNVTESAHEDELEFESVNESNSEQLCVVEGCSLSISLEGLNSGYARVEIKSPESSPNTAAIPSADRINSSTAAIFARIIKQMPASSDDEETESIPKSGESSAVVVSLLAAPRSIIPGVKTEGPGFMIEGLGPGRAVIEVFVPGSLAQGGDLYKYFMVEVVAKVPVSNMSVVELIGVLEAGGTIGGQLDALTFAASSMAVPISGPEMSLMVTLGGRDSDAPLEQQWADLRRDVAKSCADKKTSLGRRAVEAVPFSLRGASTYALGRRQQDKTSEFEDLAKYRRYGDDHYN